MFSLCSCQANNNKNNNDFIACISFKDDCNVIQLYNIIKNVGEWSLSHKFPSGIMSPRIQVAPCDTQKNFAFTYSKVCHSELISNNGSDRICA